MSGVLYGLAGFTWMLSARAPQMGLTMPSSTAMLLGGWLLLGVLMASSQDSAIRMANWAHGGGLLAGIIMGWVVAMNQKD
jgi:GlpG protein